MDLGVNVNGTLLYVVVCSTLALQLLATCIEGIKLIKNKKHSCRCYHGEETTETPV